MILSKIEIRPYRESDWPQLKDFIEQNWRGDHPFCNKRLFDWQFQGFGNENNRIRSLIMLSEGKMSGFRGVIPGLYQVPSETTGMEIVQGGSLAMWMIAEEFRGQGLGVLMHEAAQKDLPVITGAGSNPRTSIPIYLKNGFSVLESMNRFVAPLQVEGYRQLLIESPDIGEIEKWVSGWESTTPPIFPDEPDLDSIAAVWRKATFPLRIFSLYRNREFFHWRYVDSAGFKYLFFGSPCDAGVIVARVERIYSTERKELHDQKVFRIIELLPRDPGVWSGETIDGALVRLIQGAVRWAIQQGCIAADFYCTTSRLAPVLKKAGFKKQNFTLSLPECSLAILFQPLTYKARPINALYRIETPRRTLLQINFDDIYQVKSDNDMDRPNLFDFEHLD